MSAMKKTMIAVLGASVILGTVGASFANNQAKGNGNKNRGARGAEMFKTVDKNSDGKLDFSEFASKMNERFDAMDADKNGVLTAEEIKAHAAKNDKAKRGERMVKRIAKRFDVNGNNEITKAEVENREKKMFALIDMNDDGFIQPDELKNAKHHGGKRRGGGHKGKKRGWN